MKVVAMVFHPAKKTKASLFRIKPPSKEDQMLTACCGGAWNRARSLRQRNATTTMLENDIDREEGRRNPDVNKPGMLGNFNSCKV